MIGWPPCSPDLNPIEHVWKALKHGLYRLYPNLHALNNTADVEILKARIKEAWKYIYQAHIQKLVASIPARLDVCWDATK